MVTRRRVLTVGISALLILLVAAGIAMWVTWRLPFRSGNFFDEVSNTHLASQGMVLTRPGLMDWPQTSSASAEQSALRVVHRQIKRTLLLHVHFSHASKPDCLCWVISMGTPGEVAISSGPPPGSGAGHLIFSMAFVRADTGTFVVYVEVGTRT